MKRFFTGLVIAALLIACNQAADDAANNDTLKDDTVAASGRSVSAVTARRIINAEPKDWLSHGRTYDAQRFSPLD